MTSVNRRAFMVGVSSAFLVTPATVGAQPRRNVYRIGHLMLLPQSRLTVLINALEEGLRGLGYIDGENIIIETRRPSAVRRCSPMGLPPHLTSPG